jgi:hypothetical protein
LSIVQYFTPKLASKIEAQIEAVVMFNFYGTLLNF